MKPKILKLAILLFLVGCQNAEQKYQRKLEKVESQWYEGKQTQALAALEKLSQLYPQKAALFELLAHWEQQGGHWMEAAWNLERAIQLDGSRLQLRLRCAALYEEEKDWGNALRNYQEYLNKLPQSPSVWLRVAAVQEKLGHPQEALLAIYRYFEEAPKDAFDYDEALQLWWQKLELSEAPKADLLLGLQGKQPLWGLLAWVQKQESWGFLRIALQDIHQAQRSDGLVVQPEALETVENALAVYDEAQQLKRYMDCVAHAHAFHERSQRPTAPSGSQLTHGVSPTLVIHLQSDAVFPDYDTLMAQPIAVPEAPAPSVVRAVEAPAALIAKDPEPEALMPVFTRDDALALKAAADVLLESGHADKARHLYKIALRFLDDGDAIWYQIALALVAMER